MTEKLYVWSEILLTCSSVWQKLYTFCEIHTIQQFLDNTELPLWTQVFFLAIVYKVFMKCRYTFNSDWRQFKFCLLFNLHVLVYIGISKLEFGIEY